MTPIQRAIVFDFERVDFQVEGSEPREEAEHRAERSRNRDMAAVVDGVDHRRRRRPQQSDIHDITQLRWHSRTNPLPKGLQVPPEIPEKEHVRAEVERYTLIVDLLVEEEKRGVLDDNRAVAALRIVDVDGIGL